MLVALIELSVYGLFTGFTCAKNAALFDYLLDYKQYLWRLRYKLAERAAKKVGYEKKVIKALEEAEVIGADGVNIMATIYSEIAEFHYPFKLWTCIYCMTIRFAFFIILLASAFLVYLGYGFNVIFYIASAFAFTWYFLDK